MVSYCGGLDLTAFRLLPLGVRLRLAAFDLLGWRYSRTNAFPAARPGMPASLARPGVPNLGIDCSSQSSYVLITATPDGAWTAARYAELQIQDAARPWSPLDAVEAAAVGQRVLTPVPRRWHLSQTWVDSNASDGTPLQGGHARLAYCDPNDPGLLFVLESSTRTHPIDGGRLGPTWSTTRVSSLLAKYPGGVRWAVLDE